MQRIDFYFDVISPYAWLAFERLPQVLQGQHHLVNYRPVLLAGLLGHWGQKGPAEIVPKRAWTYRQVAWLAQQQGTPLQLPQPHPFNPLALMRLALAAAPAAGTPNRRVVELLFRHVWCRDGADPNQPDALADLAQAVAPLRDPAGAEVKAELRERTDAALAMQQRLVEAVEEAELLPDIDDLPEHLSGAEFSRRFGGVGAPAYLTMMADIEARLDRLPLLVATPLH